MHAAHQQPNDAQTTVLHVVYSPGPRRAHHATLSLGQAATVQHALEALPVAWREEVALLAHRGELGISIWGERVAESARLQAHDRLELCRPLRVDPKVARRERFVQQGKKRAGLFAPKKEAPRP